VIWLGVALWSVRPLGRRGGAGRRFAGRPGRSRPAGRVLLAVGPGRSGMPASGGMEWRLSHPLPYRHAVVTRRRLFRGRGSGHRAAAGVVALGREMVGLEGALVFGGGDVVQQAVKAIFVVPVQVVHRQAFHVGEVAQRAAAERGVAADGFVLV